MSLASTSFDDLGPTARKVRDWLARACRRPGCDLSLGELIRACGDGEAQLVLIEHGGRVVAAGVSQVRRHRDGRLSCWILAVGGGDVRAWCDTLAVIEAGAAAIGCRSLEFVGRPGWRRLLPDYDAAPCPAGLHYSKALS